MGEDKSPNHFYRKNVTIFIILLVVCSVVGLVAPLWPQADLFNHFRPQALVFGVLLGAVAFFINRKAALLALAVMLLNGALIAKRLYETAGIPSSATITEEGGAYGKISIISANVLTKNQKYEGLLSIVTTGNPDIIILVETDARWLENVAELREHYPYYTNVPRPDNFGMAVYAKMPFETEIIPVGSYKLPLIVADFAGFTLMAAHPIHPVRPDTMRENHEYLETMARIAEARVKPVVIAGDLNSTLWAETMTPLIEAGFKRINPLGFAYTWPMKFPLFAMQIDHFFAKGVRAGDFEVLGATGSDHYPIRADVLIP